MGSRGWWAAVALTVAASSGGPGQAASAPDNSAGPIVAAAIEAMGGRARLEGLRALALVTYTASNRLDDSEHAERPFWMDIAEGHELRDEAGGRVRQDYDVHSPQWETHDIQVDDGKRIALGASWQGGMVWVGRASLGERLALSPERVLLTAAAAPDLHRLADRRTPGERDQVVAFTWKGFPVRLEIDAASHLLRRLRTVRAWPEDHPSAMLGDIAWRTDFLFYRREPDGFTYPREQVTYRNGERAQTLDITGLTENPPLAETAFELPAEGRAALARPSTPYDAAPLPTTASGDGLEPVADGVWLVPGNWYVVVVRQSDGLVVIEAPQSSGYSEKLLARLAQRFPGGRIKAVVSTTDTLYHYAGLRPYVARGIPIYALAQTIPRLRAFAAARRTFAPDALARRPARPDLRPVSGPLRLGSGANRLALYPIGGSGDGRMMMVFLPGRGLLYGSSNDLNTAQDRVTFNTFELVRRVEALRLPVADYVAIHTGKTPWARIRTLALTRPAISAEAG